MLFEVGTECRRHVAVSPPPAASRMMMMLLYFLLVEYESQGALVSVNSGILIPLCVCTHCILNTGDFSFECLESGFVSFTIEIIRENDKTSVTKAHKMLTLLKTMFTNV